MSKVRQKLNNDIRRTVSESALRGLMRNLEYLIFVILSLIMTQAYGFAIDSPHKYEIKDLAGNTIVYEGVAYDEFNNNQFECCHGEISIFDKNKKLTFFQANVAQPACNGNALKQLPSPLKNKREIFMLCGDNGGAGNHITLYFIEAAKVIGSLELGSVGEAKVSWNPQYNTYQAEAVHRLSSQHAGLDAYYVVYEWDGKSGSGIDKTWFHPTFNAHSKAAYLAQYQARKAFLIKRVKENGLLWESVLADAALAALVATSDSNIICSELKKPPFSGFSKKEIQSAISFNKEYGYPNFDVLTCGHK